MDKLERLGDLERETIVGPSNRGAILTIVDRVSDKCWLTQTQGREAFGVYKTTLALLRGHWVQLHTIANDNGGEFTEHKLTAKTLELDIYSAFSSAQLYSGLVAMSVQLMMLHRSLAPAFMMSLIFVPFSPMPPPIA